MSGPVTYGYGRDLDVQGSPNAYGFGITPIALVGRFIKEFFLRMTRDVHFEVER